MTNTNIQRDKVLSEEEIKSMLQKADRLHSIYFRLRAKALVSLFKTGKRRGEIAALEVADLAKDKTFLYITFTLEKKRQKSTVRRTKKLRADNKYAKHIIEYRNWLVAHQPKCKYLFPSVVSVFGCGLSFREDQHLSGRQILRIIKQLNPNAWCHLFRETRGAEVVKADEKKHGEASLMTVYRVKHALDLERETTAWNYINRYATEVIKLEAEEESLA